MDLTVVPRILALIFFHELHFGWAEELLQSLTGTVGAENYTYYRLSRPGRIRVELVSLLGDADLYISQHSLNPNYKNYDAQSITCGADILEIPESYKRPVGIGIYGYPSHEVSEYMISIYLLPKDSEIDYEHYLHMFHDYEAADYMFKNYEASDYMYRDVKASLKKSSSSSRTAAESDDSDELNSDEESLGSVLWHILLTLLKVIFEVIL